MSDREIPTYPSIAALDAERDSTLWGPGLRLIQHCAPWVKGVLLLLLSGLSLVLLTMLALRGVRAAALIAPRGEGPMLEPLRRLADATWPGLLSVSPGVLAVALLAALYLAVCVWMSMRDLPAAAPPLAAAAVDSIEPHPAPEPGDEGPAIGPASDDDAGMPRRPRHELFEVHAALQLGGQQVGAAVDETARRTLALCGAFDSCTKHVEAAGADLEAIQDEAAHVQEVMAGLRAHLLTLGGCCQAIAAAAHRLQNSTAPAEAAQRIDELLEALGGEMQRCHQLSERIGGAERSSERRIDSLRRSIEGAGHHADRGLREGHQVMVLTRRMQATLAESSSSLARLAERSAALDATDPALPTPEWVAVGP
jgi:hypothetical protein